MATDNPPVSLGELLIRHRPHLLRLVQRKARGLLRYETADDLVQGIHLGALESSRHFEYQGEPAFVSWLNTIAERQLLMAVRYHSARKRDISRERFAGTSPSHPADQPSPSAAAVQGEMTALIRNAVLRLPTLERRVVEMHSFEGRSFARVAQELALSGAARARYIFQRALKAMGRMLDDPE